MMRGGIMHAMSIDEVYHLCASPCSFVQERKLLWKALRPKDPNLLVFVRISPKSIIRLGLSGNCHCLHVPTGRTPHRHCRLAHTTVVKFSVSFFLWQNPTHRPGRL